MIPAHDVQHLRHLLWQLVDKNYQIQAELVVLETHVRELTCQLEAVIDEESFIQE
jgi:hypothetical protein